MNGPCQRQSYFEIAQASESQQTVPPIKAARPSGANTGRRFLPSWYAMVTREWGPRQGQVLRDGQEPGQGAESSLEDARRTPDLVPSSTKSGEDSEPGSPRSEDIFRGNTQGCPGQGQWDQPALGPRDHPRQVLCLSPHLPHLHPLCWFPFLQTLEEALPISPGR